MGWNDVPDEENTDVHGMDDGGKGAAMVADDQKRRTVGRPFQKKEGPRTAIDTQRIEGYRRFRDRQQQEKLTECGFDPLQNDKAKNGTWSYYTCRVCQIPLLVHRFPKGKTKWSSPVCTLCQATHARDKKEKEVQAATDASPRLDLAEVDVTKDLPSAKVGAEIYGRMGYWALSRITEQKLEKATAPQLVNMARECHEMQQLLGGKPTAIVGLTRAKKIEELLPALSDELERRKRLKVVN